MVAPPPTTTTPSCLCGYIIKPHSLKRLIISYLVKLPLLAASCVGENGRGGEAGDVGRERRRRPRQHGGAAAAGEHHRPLGQGPRLHLLHLPGPRRAAAHRRPVGRHRRREGRPGHGERQIDVFLGRSFVRLVSFLLV
jgi:hypothetical protein